jgi:hypothetical protein
VAVNDRGSKQAYRAWDVSAQRDVGDRTKHGRYERCLEGRSIQSLIDARTCRM